MDGFLGLGIVIVAYSLISLVFLPANANSGDGLNWLTSDPEVLEFVGWNFWIQGAWYAMWAVPLVTVLVTLMMYWDIPFTAVLFIIAVSALLISRPLFSPPREVVA